MSTYFKMEILRTVRNGRYLIFTFLVPMILFLVIGAPNKGQRAGAVTLADAATARTTLGLAIGALLALFASRLLQRLVWGVSTMDALTFAGVGVLLLTVAAAASLLPSLRIVRLDPAQTLHEE